MQPTLAPTLAEALWPTSAGGMVRNVALAVLGSLLLTLSAKIQVPSWPVPMTMQTYVVLVLGAAYGWRLGAATMLLYLAEGAVGLPVFAGTPEKGIGLAYMAGPTGGYLVGFVLAAALIGWLAERGADRSMAKMLVAMAAGHVLILACGYAWLAGLIGPAKAWVAGVAPFAAATVIKTLLAAVTLPAAWHCLRR
jgi:biotin transport system substrate-specific component